MNLLKFIGVITHEFFTKNLNRMTQQLNKINSIGGFKTIVPSEGLVFKYKGKTYKFTGAFAPVNQIAGLIHF